jgi:hypothetical protein
VLAGSALASLASGPAHVVDAPTPGDAMIITAVVSPVLDRRQKAG